MPTDKNTVQISNWKIIGWWELRRILFNLIIFLAASVSMELLGLIVKPEPGTDLIEPLSILGFVLFLNLCYTFLWLRDIGAPLSEKDRWKYFKWFTWIAIFLVFLPTLLNLLFLIVPI